MQVPIHDPLRVPVPFHNHIPLNSPPPQTLHPSLTTPDRSLLLMFPRARVSLSRGPGPAARPAKRSRLITATTAARMAPSATLDTVQKPQSLNSILLRKR